MIAHGLECAHPRRTWKLSLVASTIVVLTSMPLRGAQAATDLPTSPPHEPRFTLWEQFDALKWEGLGLFSLITYAGIRDWKWGTAYFRFNSEGWLGLDTGSGGQDKLGHFYSTYLMTEFLYLRLRTAEDQEVGAALAPPLITWTLMTYVEMFDGYSVDHGFSYEDLLMDTAGASLALFRNAFPRIGRAFDYRLEYYPSPQEGGFHPIIDYEGQKFLFVLRPSGIPFLSGTPLRYIELYGGYYARGFKRNQDSGSRYARTYVGVGVDLEELITGITGRARDNPGSSIDYLSTSIRLFQLPYPYPKVTVNRRSAGPRSSP